MTLHRIRRLVAPVTVALLLLAQYHGAAVANHGGHPIETRRSCDRPVTPQRCTSVANNLRHYVHFDESLTDGLASSLRDTMAEDYGQTKLRIYEQRALNAATDVIAHSADYGDNGAAGWVYCPSDAPQGFNARGDRWCQRQEMHFNLNPRYGVFFADDASRDYVTCHELGHTVGLRHWGNPPDSDGPAAATCMNSDTPNGPTGLDQIDRDHINAYDYLPPPPPRGNFRIVRAPDAGSVASVLGAAGVEATGADSFGSLAELVAASDAVVRGRLVNVEPGRVFGTERHPFHYAAVTIRVDEVLAGALPSRHATELVLEVPLFDGLGSLASVRGALQGSDAVLFLRNKGESARAAGMSVAAQLADADFYRLVVLGSLVANEAGRAAAPASVPGFPSGIAFAQAVELVLDEAR